MTEQILPGTYIDVLAEGLIAPGQVTVGNLGVLGTAAKGLLGVPTLLSSYNDAIAIFGSYDSFLDPNDPTKRRTDSLTLVRALQIAFQQGASIVWAVRVSNAADPSKLPAAKAPLSSPGGACVDLVANSPGTWANGMTVTVEKPSSSDIAPVVQQTTTLAAAQPAKHPIQLAHPAAASVRNRVTISQPGATVTTPTIVSNGAGPAAGQAQITGQQLILGDPLAAGSVVTVSYVPATFVKVTIALGTTKESYLVADGTSLVAGVNGLPPSNLVTATPGTFAGQLPDQQSRSFTGGQNGESRAIYDGPNGLDTLLDVDAHIIVAAGQPNTVVGAALDAHCQKASTDVYKRDRIAIVGSDFAKADTTPVTTAESIAYVDKLLGNTISSDRVVFVAPGFLATSSAQEDIPYNPVTLPGSYTAAAIAGMLAALPPHISLTNKSVAVQDVEVTFNNAQLTELVQNGVTAIEKSNNIHVLRGQTTQVQGAFREETTRRIVDYAKYGVRSAAASYIGLLNNDRVRAALRATVNSFLQQMLDGEMLVSYTLDVTATRDQQIAGIAQVTMTLQPVFSINFIHVTMILS
jgi:hypothetical protein